MKESAEEALTRGVVEIIGAKELKEKLESGQKLRIKLGIDPTSPNIHIGRSIPLLKLRDFQKLGHIPILIVGDFTGLIGDTSDKDSERPMLSEEQIEVNKKTYFEQIGKIIDLDKAELHHNSEWLKPLSFVEVCKEASAFSVNEFISRDNIARRLDAGKSVSLNEMLYPLMQGYDSVAIKADVELGGTDQRFNLLAGRTLQTKHGQEPQSIIMSPLIDGLDGRKMSSSWGNVIALNAEPNDMYGKVMSMLDAQVITYFKLCTRVPENEIEKMSAGLEDGSIHPKDLKMRLAREIVSMYHDADSAQGAEENFIKTFSNKEIPNDIQTVEVGHGSKLVDALIETGTVESKSEWRRLVEDGAVSNVQTGESISDADQTAEGEMVLKVGKRRFIKLVVA